ncbi:hypothetical protein BC793_11836 [Actinoplanes xinjiangensis]|uniref:Uncharacterized protein n=1 Tax=Actinoplanes xinjiangensis TaxID=512350 RepID=A0A316F4T8_9ACTN|nr:hypothetical protein BC793_11836 [Actinoplanes xinjiangensis]GIF41338.1 hypothetical protein Axi01nite_56490 [Actinoplanes xinjiangensis]
MARGISRRSTGIAGPTVVVSAAAVVPAQAVAGTDGPQVRTTVMASGRRFTLLGYGLTATQRVPRRLPRNEI